jgi:hypothetical protein
MVSPIGLFAAGISKVHRPYGSVHNPRINFQISILDRNEVLPPGSELPISQTYILEILSKPKMESASKNSFPFSFHTMTQHNTIKRFLEIQLV